VDFFEQNGDCWPEVALKLRVEDLLVLAPFVPQHDLDLEGSDSSCFKLVVDQGWVSSVLSFAGCFNSKVLHFLILVRSNGLDEYNHLGKLLFYC
jgi:hypothetical protein